MAVRITGSHQNDDRAALAWAAHQCGWDSVRGERLAGDASARHYLRLHPAKPEESPRMLMISPPAKGEKNEEFAVMSGLLHDLGLRVPEVHYWHRAEGWLVLTDCGERQYLDELTSKPQQRPTRYRQALEMIVQIQKCPSERLAGLERMSDERAQSEAQLVESWYLERLLGVKLQRDTRQKCREEITWLAGQIGAQPAVLVHFDFHSRNLLHREQGAPALLDFQDALVGPIALDLASLLRDCYLELPENSVTELLEYYRQRALEERILPAQTEPQTLATWFEQCSLQRHLRVLGTFARLHIKYGRSGYLKELPLTLKYSLRACNRLAQLPTLQSVLARTEALLPAAILTE